MVAAASTGFFGKFFTRGDFVDRRLPREFLDAWDGWLQGAMAASREQLGSEWLGVYLHSPIWRFGLSPGLCGSGAWAGVLMPSVDSVGRHYPLTLAAPVAAEDLPHLFGTHEGTAWFAELQTLALSCLKDGFDLDAFDRSLQACRPPRFASASLPLESATPSLGSNKFACHVGMPSLEQVPAAFLDLNAALMKHLKLRYSLWSSVTERDGASLILLEGLLPIDAYTSLLNGRWQQRNWPLETITVRLAQSEQQASIENPPERVFDADEITRPRHRVQQHPTQWHSKGLSWIGKVRSLNEDALLDKPEIGLWAVADGMGGHHAGDVASQTIVAALAEITPSTDVLEFAKQASQALFSVNSQLIRMAKESGGEGQVIGSTVVVLLAAGNRCAYLWAGDSRLYRFRAGQLEQLTHDHSLFAEFARKGLLTPEQLAEPSRCDTITRAVGATETLALEQGECEAHPGDLYLLCSDGLDKELSREDIEAVFRATPPEDIAGVLIQQTEDRGARDNVTAIVVGFSYT